MHSKQNIYIFFTIDSNNTWSIAEPSVNWITLSKYSGSGSQAINITVLENPSAYRTTTLTITSACGVTKQITIRQNETCAFTATITQ
jgi:hypothetical protein